MIKIIRSIFLSFLVTVSIFWSHGITAHEAPGSLGQLVYVQDGDLWVKSLPEGQERQLTSDGQNYQPRWSPSGQWLAYRKNDQLWVMNRSGTGVKVLSEGASVREFAWSPKEDILAYADESGSLRLVRNNGWLEQALVGGSNSRNSGVSSLAWNSEGEWLAYSRREVVWEGSQATQIKVGLQKVRVDGHESKDLLESVTIPGKSSFEFAGITVAGWSQDSQHILFWALPELSASLLADGVPLMSISTNGGEATEVCPGMLAYPDFWQGSPDGKYVAIAAGVRRESWARKRIAKADLTNHTFEYLTDDRTAALSPAWSPDGQRIAYIAAPDAGFEDDRNSFKELISQRHLWLTNLDGSEHYQLTTDPQYRDELPLWSADSTYLLFVRLNQDQELSIWMMSAKGQTSQQVVSRLTSESDGFDFYGHLNWSDYFDWWQKAPS